MNATTRVVAGGYSIIADTGSGWRTTTVSNDNFGNTNSVNFYVRIVTWNGTHFVAVGNSETSITGSTNAAYSADGINWTFVSLPTVPTNGLYARVVISVGSAVYAIADGAGVNFNAPASHVLKSTDNGVTWSVEYSNTNANTNIVRDQFSMAASGNTLYSVGWSTRGYRYVLP
ncbi:MAG: hypothetical protein HC858_02600 [Brachymonas sp.]|nr:hypothetical protein [Brachymonas sp.]